jgi:hypothetical protein
MARRKRRARGDDEDEVSYDLVGELDPADRAEHALVDELAHREEVAVPPPIVEHAQEAIVLARGLDHRVAVGERESHRCAAQRQGRR